VQHNARYAGVLEVPEELDELEGLDVFDGFAELESLDEPLLDEAVSPPFPLFPPLPARESVR
jgi:hypothetical protein